MSTCIGIVRKTGKPCKNKKKPGKQHCNIHDPALKKNKKGIPYEKKMAVMRLMAERVKYVPSDAIIREKELEKESKATLARKTKAEIDKIIKKGLDECSLIGNDFRSLIDDKETVQFPRKVWMIIGWHLIQDAKSYENASLTCKKLYHVFLEDKYKWYVHPLKMLKSPRLFFFPLYRIIQFEVPKDLDEILQLYDIETSASVETEYMKAFGHPKDQLETFKMKGDIFMELCSELVSKMFNSTDEESEFVEDVKGAGHFTNAEKDLKLDFEEPEFKYKSYDTNKIRYVMIKPMEGKSIERLERDIVNKLRNYDGKYLIKLMRVQ